MPSPRSAARLRLRGVSLAPALLLLAGAVGADDWYLAPEASLESFYDDNVRLSAADAQSSFGVIGRANASFGRRTEISDLAIEGGLSLRRYGDVTELDRTEGFLGLDSAYRLARHRLGLTARLDYDSTLTSEISTSGLVQVNKRRTRLFARPSWSYELSERAALDLSASYTDVSYEDVERIPLYDYTLAGAGLTGTYLWSERSELFARLNLDRYEAAQVDTRSDTLGLLAGGSYALSETLSLTALAGLRYTRAETPALTGGTDEQSSTGPLVDFSLEKRFEVGHLRLTASQALSPSSTGELLNTTSGGLALAYPVNARWSFVVNAHAYRNRDPAGERDSNDRDYLSIAPRLRHKLSDWWHLEVGYRFRYQHYTERGDEASSNAVFLTLSHTWPSEPVGSWSLLR